MNNKNKEGLTYFKESYTYQFLPNSNKIKLTEDGRQKYLSSSVLDTLKKFVTKDIYEDICLRIARNDIDLYKFPIARYGTLNINGRIYPKPLFERLRDDPVQVLEWQYIAGCSDHTEGEDPAPFERSAIVWLALEIDDNSDLVYGIGIPVGKYGGLIKDMEKNYGKIGFSMSGWGQLERDGITVVASNYIIERLADVVTFPSQRVFGHFRDKVISEQGEYKNMDTNKLHENGQQASQQVPVNNQNTQVTNGQQQNQTAPVQEQPVQTTQTQQNVQQPVVQEPVVQEPVVQEQNIQIQSNTQQPIQESAILNKGIQQMKENSFGMRKFNEKMARDYIIRFLEDTKNTKNPLQRLRELDSIEEAFDGGFALDLREQVQNQLVAERERLEKLVENAVKIESELGDTEKLVSQVKRLGEHGMELKEAKMTYENIIIDLTNRLKEAGRKLTKETGRALRAERERDRLQSLLERAKNRVTSIITASEEEKQLVERDAKVLERKLNESLRVNKDLQDKLISFTKMTEAKRLTESKLNRTERDYEVLLNKFNEQVELNKTYEKQIGNLQSRCKGYQEEAMEARKNYISLKEQIEYEADPEMFIRKRGLETKLIDTSSFEADDRQEVADYWDEVYSRFGESVKGAELKIKGSKSLAEAKQAYMEFVSNDTDFSDIAKIKNSMYNNRVVHTF